MLTLFLIVLILIVGFAIKSGLMVAVGERIEDRQPKYRYSRKLYMMSKPEALCFRKLEEAVGQTYYVFPQVHLSSLLDHTVKGQNWKGALAKIQRKSVDFVLVDRASLQTAFAIELDDASHFKQDRQERDAFVNEIIRTAGIPLVRLQHNELDDAQKLVEKLEQART